MTPEEKRAAERRIKEITEEIRRLSNERLDLRWQLVHSATEPARRRLATGSAREREAKARAARLANRERNPVDMRLPRGDRE